MKLIYCPDCGDIVRLTGDHVTRKCRCHRSWGRYLDNLNAQYNGNAIPLGIDNLSFKEAIQEWNIRPEWDNYESIDIEAFTIPKQCKTFKKVDK